MAQAKRDLVDRVVAKLALESCRNTCIGSVLSRGISGGEVCKQRSCRASMAHISRPSPPESSVSPACR